MHARPHAQSYSLSLHQLWKLCADPVLLHFPSPPSKHPGRVRSHLFPRGYLSCPIPSQHAKVIIKRHGDGSAPITCSACRLIEKMPICHVTFVLSRIAQEASSDRGLPPRQSKRSYCSGHVKNRAGVKTKEHHISFTDLRKQRSMRNWWI